jgi:hypothetical protein
MNILVFKHNRIKESRDSQGMSCDIHVKKGSKRMNCLWKQKPSLRTILKVVSPQLYFQHFMFSSPAFPMSFSLPMLNVCAYLLFSFSVKNNELHASILLSLSLCFSVVWWLWLSNYHHNSVRRSEVGKTCLVIYKLTDWHSQNVYHLYPLKKGIVQSNQRDRSKNTTEQYKRKQKKPTELLLYCCCLDYKWALKAHMCIEGLVPLQKCSGWSIWEVIGSWWFWMNSSIYVI